MPATQPPIPVHALDGMRIHLAPPHRGRLRQGRLKTLCGKLAVSELPLFVMAEKKGRCPKCFALLGDSDGQEAGTKPGQVNKTRRQVQ
jgi:hypothetical protein